MYLLDRSWRLFWRYPASGRANHIQNTDHTRFVSQLRLDIGNANSLDSIPIENVVDLEP